jgi:hypothetical protein
LRKGTQFSCTYDQAFFPVCDRGWMHFPKSTAATLFPGGSLGSWPSSIMQCQLYRLPARSHTKRISINASAGRSLRGLGSLTWIGSFPLASASSRTSSRFRIPVFFQYVVRKVLR